uniref:Axin-1 n=1 Tax=Lygus hesperus TaxID=30085 RepID=A0A0A9VWT5_LYGHE
MNLLSFGTVFSLCLVIVKSQAPPDDDSNELQGNLWERKIKGKTIMCATSDVKFCKAVHKGKWKPSIRNTNDDGVPENSTRVMFPGDAKIYCDFKIGKPCPKIKKVTWGPPEGKEQDKPKANQWELTVNGTVETIKCVAYDISDCNKILGGSWKQCNKSNEDSKWWIPLKNAKVYCNEESYENCPNVQGRHGWEKNPGNPDEPAPMWQLKGKGEKLICMAFNAKDCKKSHKGQWKRRSGGRNADGVPNKAKWWLIVGKVRVFCDKNSKKSCPKVDKGKDEWHEILGGSDEENDSEQIYELGVGGETFVCRARNVEDCKKFREGVWKPNKDRKEDANGVPEGSNWFVPVGESKVYCYKKSTKSCPIVGKGEEWQKVPGGAGEESVWTNFTNDDRDVDAGKNRTRSDFRWTI